MSWNMQASGKTESKEDELKALKALRKALKDAGAETCLIRTQHYGANCNLMLDDDAFNQSLDDVQKTAEEREEERLKEVAEGEKRTADYLKGAESDAAKAETSKAEASKGTGHGQK